MDQEDIRKKAWADHNDILDLNFIRRNPAVLFRQHHRQGLRSVIMEVLSSDAVDLERHGVVIDGVRRFPAAVPRKMFRIFRAGFDCLQTVLRDIRRIHLVLSYLTARHMAVSEEMILSYRIYDRYEMVLCGLQNFIEGEPLDPWGRLPDVPGDEAQDFIDKIKRLALETGLIPDLAGIGNVIFAPSGDLVLVDINNISTVDMDGTIRPDDKGYPVCDKSVEALSILESRLMNRPIDHAEPLYAHFLTGARREKADRMVKMVRALSATPSF
jgi:hypothetical protein